MAMKSVLLLTNAYPDFHGSYRGEFIRKMAFFLDKEGYRCCVVTPKLYKGSRLHEREGSVEIYRYPFMARGKLLIEYQKIPYVKMGLYFLTGIALTAYVLFRRRCGLVHAHWAVPTGVIGAIVAGLTRKPLIVTIHGSDLRIAMDRKGLICRLFRWVCHRADHVHCVSKVQAKALEQIGIPAEKISVFPMGVDQSFVEHARNRNDLFPEGAPTVLSNRNLQPIYNVALLIRAIPIVVQEVPEAKFLIAGEGPEREGLEREAATLGVSDHVQFLGRVPPDEMPRLLREADVYVSTSLYDGTSVSLLEAMASGCFPVVSDIPSNREWIVDGENGLLFPVENAQVLAQKVLEGIQNRSLVIKGRGKNIRIIEEKALWPILAKGMKNIYETQLHLNSLKRKRG